MPKKLLLVSFAAFYLGVGTVSYLLIAGSQADWWQLVTYVWVLFWPFVILLGFLYFRPLLVLAALAIAFISWRMARRRG
jgi:hypothetical protein